MGLQEIQAAMGGTIEHDLLQVESVSRQAIVRVVEGRGIWIEYFDLNNKLTGAVESVGDVLAVTDAEAIKLIREWLEG